MNLALTVGETFLVRNLFNTVNDVIVLVLAIHESFSLAVCTSSTD